MSKTDFIKEITPDIDQTKDRVQAIEEFINLQNHPGWQRLVKVIGPKIQEYEKAILDTEVDGEELRRIRDRRDLCLWFSNLPDVLVTILMDVSPETEEPVFDPYDAQRVVDNQEGIG